MADNDVTRIAGNIGAMNALYSLQNINKQLSIHQTRLATGKRINSAADDPAGLAISTKMWARSEGLKTALSNIGDAKNLLAVAESGMGRLTDILNSMRTITENAANDTNGTDERNIVKEQLASYAKQINDIVEQTKWSDKQLINGSFEKEADALTFQTGADWGETTKLSGLTDMHALKMLLMREDSTLTAGSSSVSEITGASSFTEGDFTVSTNVATGTQLAYGTYSVNVTVAQAEVGGDYTYSVQLMSGGAAVTGGLLTGTYASGSSTAIVTFDNGLTINLASAMQEVKVAGVTEVLRTASIASATAGLTLIEPSTAKEVISGELATGTDYYVTYSFTGTTSVTAQLWKGNGTDDDADPDGVEDVQIGTDVTHAYATTGITQIDFGNGLSIGIAGAESPVNVAQGTDSVVSGTISYTQYVAPVTAVDGTKTSVGSVNYTPAETQRDGVNIREDATYGTDGKITYTSKASDFADYMKIVDAAMVSVNAQLSKIGSLTGSLTFKEDQISSSQINVEASYNRIMNANMAEEQVNASKLLILQQTSTAMLAQANAAPQFLLSLFK